jgi:hypothetical protein
MTDLIRKFESIGYKGMSVLFHSTNADVVSYNDIQSLAEQAVESSGFQSIDFIDIPKNRSGRVQFLEQYNGKNLIVTDVFESGAGYSSDDTKAVFKSMRSNQLDFHGAFLMFDYNPESRLYLKERDNDHPMKNWNEYVDLSDNGEDEGLGSAFTRIRPNWDDF